MNIIYIVLAALIAVCSAIGLLPAARQAVVLYVAQNYMHRDLNMNYWMQQLFALAFIVFVVNLLLFALIKIKKVRQAFMELAGEVKKNAIDIYRQKKYVLIIFAIYCFSFISIIRANHYYGGADDLYRAMSGARAWRNFYRYISHFLSIFVHTSPKIFDIAPFPQILALLIMSIAAAIIIKIFGRWNAPLGDGAENLPAEPDASAAGGGFSIGKLSLLTCIAAIPVGIFPYFLENLSYRYDAPYMALSVLFSVVPFLFADRLLHFAIVSVLSLFLMCLSYQASSGVYIVICAFLVFKFWTENKKPLKYILLFVLTSVICYGLTLGVFFSIFNVPPDGVSYVDKNASLSSLLPNVGIYLVQLWEDFGWSTIKIFSIILMLLFTAASVVKSRRNRLATAAVAVFLIVFSVSLSYGAYLVMAHPLMKPRSMFAVGIVVSLMAVSLAGFICSSGIGKKLAVCSRIVILVLSYSIVVYAFAFGNAQNSQKEYVDFRTTLLLEDLSKLVGKDQTDISIHTVFDADYTLIVKNLARTYPLTTRMIDNSLGGHSMIFLLQQYGLGLRATKDKFTPWTDDLSDYAVLCDSLYHTIYMKENSFYVILKNPDITLRE